MMARPQTFKLFLPSEVLAKGTCLLLGTKNVTQNYCCITNYVLLQDTTVDALNQSLYPDINVLGLLLSGESDCDPELLAVWQFYLGTLPQWMTLTRVNKELPTCMLHGSWQHLESEVDVTVIIFSAKDLDASCLLESYHPHSNIGQLYAAWQQGLNFQVMCRKKRFSFIKGFVSLDANFLHICCNKIQRCLLKLCLILTSVIDLIFNNRLVNGCALCHHLPKSAVINHLQKKSRMLHESIIHCNKSRLDKIRLTGVLWQQVLDMILGVSIMFFLSHHSKSVGSQIMDWTEVVAAELEQLLIWMMGVPAGLKLNKELAHFLGQFFIYHVYLWKGYLLFLYPIWTDAVWWITVSGCLGLTLQLSIIQDLFSLMTLHCYCFYVYAARLYSLQVYALQSLWRLFCGKKWNPLFQRVDSSSYDVDQLFIGTLLFTILLFLLPTTGLFYAVFTILRLLVLAVQGILYNVVAITDYFSFYALYLRLFTPNKVAADVQMHVELRKGCQPLYHHFQLHPVPLLRLFQLISLPTVCKHQIIDTWPTFLEKLVTGKLVYPWVE